MIQKHTPIEIKILDKHNVYLSVGDYIISSSGRAEKVLNIFEDENGTLKVTVLNSDNREHTTTLQDALSYSSIYKGTLEQLEKDVASLIVGNNSQESVASDSTELATSNSKEALEALRMQTAIKAENMKSAINVMRERMDALRSKALKGLDALKEQTSALTSAIHSIELYLGTNEYIKHILVGNSAPKETPLHIMQATQFMDEIIGDPSDGGYELKDINKFNEWLVGVCPYYKFPRYMLILPYEKSVCAVRVRRNEKDRGIENPFIRTMYGMEDKYTFLYIRNGSNVYLLETDINFGVKMFPSKTEFIDILESNSRFFDKEKEVEVLQKRYKKKFLVLQGVSDRTEIIGKYNFMSGASLEDGSLKLVYDADTMNISDGVIPFDKFIEAQKEKIGVGSRILITHIERKVYFDRYDERYSKANYHSYHDNSPNLNQEYMVEEIRESTYGETLFKVLFVPKNYWDDAKRKRMAFWLSLNEIVPADMLEHKDFQYLERSLYDRSLRNQYLKIIPQANALYTFLKKEMDFEKPFAQMIQGATGCTYVEAVDAIYWWKTKNKYKRALSVDDAKAYRMIVKKMNKHDD